MNNDIKNNQRRHCGLDPQSPGNSAGDSCFRRNDSVDWNDDAIPLLWRGRGGLILFFLFLFTCTYGKAFASADTLQNKLLLTNDSGFVTKKEGLAFLLANSLIDLILLE